MYIYNCRFNIDNFIMQIHNFIVNSIMYSLSFARKNRRY